MGPSHYDISLHADNLTVQRAGRDIVAGVCFNISPGQALILRGSNGSGKTSLLRALAGFSRIVAGTLCFRATEQDTTRSDLDIRNMHFLGHENGISSKLSVQENLNFFQSLLGFGQGPTLSEVITHIGLTLQTQEPASRLSAGQKRRLALGRLLVAPRAIWLLDEPATALDAKGQHLLHDLCQAHRANGGIIVLSAHEGFTLPEARKLVLQAGSEEPPTPSTQAYEGRP